MITVIIPSFDRCRYLGKAIASVCTQSFPEYELIVVDDGSKDGTREEVTRLAPLYSTPINYIYQENMGAAAARNTGVRSARYDTVCFLDSDDWFMPGKLTKQYNALQDSSCLVSHTREIWYRRGKVLQQKKKHQPPNGDIFYPSLRMCMVGMSTVMMHRSIFERYGYFDENLPCCEDYDFWLRVSAREHFLLVDDQLTSKNGGRSDQLSVKYREGMDRFRIRSLVKLLHDVDLTHRQFCWARDELERKCRIYGEGCIKHGKIEEGLSVLRIPFSISQHSG